MATDIATIRTKMLASMYVASPPSVTSIVSAQQPNGSWGDVKYSDQAGAQTHLDKLYQLAVSYVVTKAPATLAAISKGLSFWYAADPEKATTTQWWINFYERWIGQPHVLSGVLLMAQDGLPKDLVSNCVAKFLIVPDDIAVATPKTGANLTDISLNQLWRGVITQNGADIAKASVTIQGSLAFSTGDGVQSDFSYHFHDRELYTGGYGTTHLQDAITAASFLAGTQWAFSAASLNALCDFFLKGLCVMTVRQEIDYSSKGRYVSRPDANGGGWFLPGLASTLTSLVPARKSDLDGFASFAGNAHYWRSDFMVHRTPAIYFSVKTLSDRTCGQESINGENQKGQWMSFGLTKISVSGGEYDDVFPVWDWNKLPGVTCPSAPAAGPYTHDATSTGGTPFVGGVSDGRVGAATMVVANTYVDAKKSWFFVTPTVMVALGAGISGPAGTSLFTTLNQCLVRGTVVVDGVPVGIGQSKSTTGAVVITHDGIAYALLQPAKCSVSCATMTGSWRSITTGGSPSPVQKNIFTATIDSTASASASGSSYAYAVSPVSGTNDVTYNIVVLSNTTALQAVFHAPSKVVQAVFFSAGKLQGNGFACQVDEPCLLQLDMSNNVGTVSSPLSSVGSVNVVYNGRSFVVALPNGDANLSGKSVSFRLA